MEQTHTRWVLAFDASCCACGEIAAAVSATSGRKLEVLPLASPQVQEWLSTTAPAAPRPTLLRVGPVGVRIWTGAAMSAPLVRRLGPRATTRVLHALGRLRRQATGHPLEPKNRNGIERGRFLRIAAGAAVAAGIVVAGKTPAFAGQTGAAALNWAEANKNALPQEYDAIAEYPVQYRHAIYAQLPVAGKQRFWLTHLSRYRAANTGLSARQSQVIADVEAVVRRPGTFEGRLAEDEGKRLTEAVKAAFGPAAAGALVATLGPESGPESGRESDQAAAAPTAITVCVCSDVSDYCSIGLCRRSTCLRVPGCGFLGLYTCDGFCKLV
jgi:hypothetical protein